MNTIKLILSVALLMGVAPIHAEDLPADYPLKTCVVSGEKLGEHGKIVKVSDNGTDVYLCCKMCGKDFKKDPAKFTKMVTDARAEKK